MDTTTVRTTTDRTDADRTDAEQLPATIRAFLDAQEARDADAALAVLTSEAVITDIGEPFTGVPALRRFVREAGAEFTYTSEISEVGRDGVTWVVGHHLEGDFPGGMADLDYRFMLEGDLIARLDIVVG